MKKYGGMFLAIVVGALLMMILDKVTGADKDLSSLLRGVHHLGYMLWGSSIAIAGAAMRK